MLSDPQEAAVEIFENSNIHHGRRWGRCTLRDHYGAGHAHTVQAGCDAFA